VNLELKEIAKEGTSIPPMKTHSSHIKPLVSFLLLVVVAALVLAVSHDQKCKEEGRMSLRLWRSDDDPLSIFLSEIFEMEEMEDRSFGVLSDAGIACFVDADVDVIDVVDEVAVVAVVFGVVVVFVERWAVEEWSNLQDLNVESSLFLAF
jgi:hypothetical protein